MQDNYNNPPATTQNGILKPSSFEEIFSKTFKLYFKLFKVLIIIAIIPNSLHILSSVLFTLMSAGVQQTSQSDNFNIISKLAAMAALMLPVLFIYVITMLASFILSAWAVAASIKVISEHLKGNDIQVNEALDESKKYILGIFFGGIVVSIRVFIGCLLLIVPGILAALNNALFQQCIVIEDLDPIYGPARSRELVRNKYLHFAHPRWYILGGLVIFGIISSTLNMFFNLPSILLGIITGGFLSFGSTIETFHSPVFIAASGLMSGLAQFLSTSLIFPLFVMFSTLVYMDLIAKSDIKKQNDLVKTIPTTSSENTEI